MEEGRAVMSFWDEMDVEMSCLSANACVRAFMPRQEHIPRR